MINFKIDINYDRFLNKCTFMIDFMIDFIIYISMTHFMIDGNMTDFMIALYYEIS